MQAHALTVRISKVVEFPFLCLLISGGHSLLTYVKSLNEFMLLGESMDDAPGELFDKIARDLKLRNMLEFQHLSGGAAIEKVWILSTDILMDDINCFCFPIGNEYGKPFSEVRLSIAIGQIPRLSV